MVQIVGLIVRMFAVFLVVYNLGYSFKLIGNALALHSNYVGAALYIILGFIPTLVATFLWAFPLAIASKLIPDLKTVSSPPPITGDELQVVAFSVLGLWVLTTALPEGLYWTAFYYRAKADALLQPELPPASIATMVSIVVKLVLGFSLLFGSKGIVGLVRRFRYAGA